MVPLLQVPRRGALAVLLVSAFVAACAPKYVIVPERREGYTARDTLYGRLKGRDIRVTFRHDTTWRTDTVTRWRTIYERGSRVDTVVVVDARRPDERPGVGNGGRRYGARVDTVFVVVHDTVRVVEPRRPGSRIDTVRVMVHDTVRIAEPGRPGRPGGPIVMPPPPNVGRVDTVRIVVHDTIRVTVRDTVRVAVHDTVRVGGDGGNGGGEREGDGHGRRAHPRTTIIPPGQYPPTGACRIWIEGTPPGQQAHPAACDALGTIPAGAFILFNGRAWDADYDWSADPDAAHVPPEILAIARHRHH